MQRSRSIDRCSFVDAVSRRVTEAARRRLYKRTADVLSSVHHAIERHYVKSERYNSRSPRNARCDLP